MIKKEHIIPFVVSILSVAFVTISVLLYFDKNNKWLVSRKLKLGGLMLTLTAIISSCGGETPEQEDIVKCYKVTMNDTITNIENDTIENNNQSDSIDVLDTAKFQNL